MKLAVLLLTLLMMPIHTEAKTKAEGRFLTALNPFVCKRVLEIGSTSRGQYIRMGNGTDKDMTVVTIGLSNRDRIQAALMASTASLDSDGRVVFCLSAAGLDTGAKEFTLSDSMSFSAMTGSPGSN
jgi:hypothetical protein